MSHTTTGSARVVNVAAGLEHTGRTAPVRDRPHQALAVLIGKWINEGHTTGTAEIPPVPILTSDVYEWAPGGFFVEHSAFGKIGDTAVGGVEIIGVDGEPYYSTFYDSFGNVHRSRLEIEGHPAPAPRLSRRRRRPEVHVHAGPRSDQQARHRAVTGEPIGR